MMANPIMLLRMACKGIVLAAGAGTRLHPVTLAVSKLLLPVYDKPMIYYPLSTLMLAGIRDILVVSSSEHLPFFRRLLGDGHQWGLSLSYGERAQPEGNAQSFIWATEFIGNDPVAFIDGGNILYGQGLRSQLQAAAQHIDGATVFACRARDSKRAAAMQPDQYGDALGIADKSGRDGSNLAIPGMYFYDNRVLDIAASLKQSARGDLEIKDVNRVYLELGVLKVEILARGAACLDTETHESLLQAAAFVEALESRQGLKICCPEEIAFRFGYIDVTQLRNLARCLSKTSYGAYLLEIAASGIPPTDIADRSGATKDRTTIGAGP